MKDSPSMMLSSLTVGDKQHPKLGGCVGVFLQLFDWNRRLSCKRFFSQKLLPAERPARHASKKVRDDNTRVPMESLLLIADKNREDLQTNDCKEENYTVNMMALSEGENSDKHKRRPGVVARLMGLESLPAPDCHEKKEAKPISQSTVHVESNHLITTLNSACEKKKIEDAFALEHGLPDEKIKAWLDDFDGILTTNLSVLHTHKSIASSCPATTRTSVNGGTSSPSSPCLTTTRTIVNIGISSPSSNSCPPSPRRNVDMGTSSPAFEHSLKALSCGSRRQNLGKSSSAKSLKSQSMCTSGDGSDLDQAYQRARVNGHVGGKGVNMMKVNDNFATKRTSEKVNTNNSSKHDAKYMKINGGKSTCKKRRSKADQQGIALQIAEAQERAASSQAMVFVNQARNYGNCRINSNGIIANQSLASNNNINHPGCYYKRKSKVAAAARAPSSINGHLDDSGRESKNSELKEGAQKSAEILEPASKKVEFSLMKILVKRRAAREAAAAAAMEAAGLMDPPALPERREKLSAGRSEGGGVFMLRPPASIPVSGDSHDNATCLADSCAGDFDRRQLNAIGITVPSLPSSPGGVQLEICGQSSGKTTAAILQDVICALNARTAECTSVSGRRRPADDDGGGATPSTAEGQDSESTSDSMCWAGTSQPSPVSVLVSPFDDEAPPAGDNDGDPQDTWHITSEEDYVAAILAATSESGPSSLSRDSRRRAELFRKLEARVVAGWPDSEAPPTRGHRLLIFDCVREALEEGVAWKGSKDRRRWQRLLTRVLHTHIRGLGKDAGDLVLDDLVDADLRKPGNRWSGFETETGGIVSAIEHTLIHLLLEELVCDLVLA